MNRQGFTLIEVMVAIAISGFIATILFTSLFQISSASTVAESVMTANEKAARLEQLFERDLSGATTLLDNKPQQEEKDLQQTTTAQQAPQEKKADKQEKNIIEKIFYSANKGNQLEILSFVSNNPLLGFWHTTNSSFQAGGAKPLLTRITYQLEEDRDMPGSYVLTRQESIPLEFGQRSGKTYPVVGGIKSLSIQYTSKTVKKTEPKAEKTEDKKDAQAQQTPPKKQKPTIDTTYILNLATWDSDEYIKKDVKKEGIQETTYPIPVFVDIEAIVYDTQQREIKYVFSIPIITDTEFMQKRRPLSLMSLFKPQQADAEKKTPAQPSAATPQQQGIKNAFMPNTQLRKQLDDIFKTAGTPSNQRGST
jgi:prepilin-type N-terminal cleavage/methylation domain-containing protein